MSSDESNSPEQEGEVRRRLMELRPKAECRKRYGRAIITIRRWGGLDELVGASDVAKKINRFRAGDGNAEDVAWAFVRARVESHSPGFRWGGADLERLIRLVTDCSESPHFTATTADALAAELVKAQDQTKETLRRTSEQFSRSFDSFRSLSQLMSPQLTRLAEQQQKTFTALSRAMTPRLTQQLAGIAELMPALGLTVDTRKAVFPILQSAVQLSGDPAWSSLVGQSIRLPDDFRLLTNSLEESLTVFQAKGFQTKSALPALSALTEDQTFTFGELIRAADEAADLVERAGEHEVAVELASATADTVEVIADPSSERLEQAVADLSQRIDDLSAQLASNEGKRDRQNQTNLAVNVLFFVLQVFLSYFFWQLDQRPPAPPPQPPAPTPPHVQH